MSYETITFKITHELQEKANKIISLTFQQLNLFNSYLEDDLKKKTHLLDIKNQCEKNYGKELRQIYKKIKDLEELLIKGK